MAGKRGYGRGSVYQRKDGKWVAAISIDGKRIVRYAKTRKEAVAKLDDLRFDERQGTLAIPSDLTLRGWIDQWLTIVGPDLRPSTRQTYRQTLNMLPPGLLDTRLHRLTPLLLMQAFGDLLGQGRGRRRLQLCHSYLKTCLKRAVDLQVIPLNPMERVPRPRAERQRRSYWTLEQTQAFVRTGLRTHYRWGPLFVFLATTGMRISEALGLKWADIDIGGKTARVERAVVRRGSTVDVLPPKTKAGRRVVSLPGPAVRSLQQLDSCAHQSDAVFQNIHGRTPRNEVLRRALHRLCDQAEVPKINIHGLRHVAAMLAFEAVDDIYLVQQRLGHSHVGVTLAVYGYPARDESVVAPEIDRLLDLPEDD